MAKKKNRSLMVMTVRLNPNHYEKLGWMAAEQDSTIADILRTMIATATRGITAPKALKSSEIVCTEGEWQNWEKVAASMSTTTDKLIGRLMNGLATRAGLNPSGSEENTAHSADQQRF